MIEGRHEKVVAISVQYDSFMGLMFLLEPPFYGCRDVIFPMESLVYLNPYDHGQNFEKHTQPFMCHQLGDIMSTCTWDLVFLDELPLLLRHG
jgi:hypothetical protein